MTLGLSDRGEEYLAKNGWIGLDYELIIYVDNTDIDGDSNKEGDDLSDTDGTSAITSEPNNAGNPTGTVQSGDIAQFNGDWGFRVSNNIDVKDTVDRVDAVAVVEQGTTDIIARAPIEDPEPAPYQDLAGLKTLELSPQITAD